MIQTTSKRQAIRRAILQRGPNAGFEAIEQHCLEHSGVQINRKDWWDLKSLIRRGAEENWQPDVFKETTNERGKQMFSTIVSKQGVVREAIGQLGYDAEYEKIKKYARQKGVIIDRQDWHNGKRSVRDKNGSNGHPNPPKQFLLTADPANGGSTKLETFKPLDPAEAVKMVKELANRLGGMENLRRLIDAMA